MPVPDLFIIAPDFNVCEYCGKPAEIKISTELKIKLSKKQKKEQKEKLRQIHKHKSGSIKLELFDPFKDFKDKIKAIIKGEKK